jgi:hypothetical protein
MTACRAGPTGRMRRSCPRVGFRAPMVCIRAGTRRGVAAIHSRKQLPGMTRADGEVAGNGAAAGGHVPRQVRAGLPGREWEARETGAGAGCRRVIARRSSSSPRLHKLPVGRSVRMGAEPATFVLAHPESHYPLGYDECLACDRRCEDTGAVTEACTFCDRGSRKGGCFKRCAAAGRACRLRAEDGARAGYDAFASSASVWINLVPSQGKKFKTIFSSNPYGDHW